MTIQLGQDEKQLSEDVQMVEAEERRRRVGARGVVDEDVESASSDFSDFLGSALGEERIIETRFGPCIRRNLVRTSMQL